MELETKDRFSPEVMWEFMFHQEYNRLMEKRMWDRWHENLFRYCANYLNVFYSAKSKEDVDDFITHLHENRDPEINGTAQWEKEMYDKFIQRFK